MNLLLDTHIALWAITDSPRLSARARELLADPSAVVWVSVASVWEIAIKHRLGRGDMPVSGTDALRYFGESRFKNLPVQGPHAAALDTLPLVHTDPFDRLIVAQALIEPMRLLTHDATVASYSDTILRV